MPRSRDFLERFRPSGTPGGAARSGVPADHVAERAAELEPIFSRLAEVEDEVRRIRADAEHEAAQQRARAAERARALLAAARRDADAEHADAAARVRRRAQAEADTALAAARREAAQIRARADRQLPEQVDEAVRRIREEITALLAEGQRQ